MKVILASDHGMEKFTPRSFDLLEELGIEF